MKYLTLKKVRFSVWISGLMFISCFPLWSKEQTITLYSNPNVTEEGPYWVNLGIPVERGAVADASEFRILDEEGEPVPVFVEPVLTWHFLSEDPKSIRSLKVQMEVDLHEDPVVYTFDFKGRDTTTDLGERPIEQMVMPSEVTGKAEVNEPMVIPVIDPEYLATTGAIPPYEPSTDDAYDTYIQTQFDLYWKDLDYTESRGANWLFDRTTALYKHAMRSGRHEVYLEAYRSYQWWYSKLRQEGDCVGSFGYDGKECDSKYMYSEPMKLHLMLMGDDSSYDPDFVNALAETSWDRCWGGAQGLKAPYTDLYQPLTERHIGLTLLTLVNAYELTGDPSIRIRIVEGINNIYETQNGGNNPDGFSDDGSLRHSWNKHEGDLPYLGMAAETLESGAKTLVLKNVADISLVEESAPISLPSEELTASGEAVDNGDGTWTIPLNEALNTEVSENSKIMWANTTWKMIPSDRGFSPWMFENITDAMWHAYSVLDVEETIRSKMETYFTQAGKAIALYAFAPGSFNEETREALESAYDHTFIDYVDDPQAAWGVGCSENTPVQLYFASSVAPRTTMAASPYRWTSLHNPEAILSLTLAAHFEDEEEKKKALLRLIEDLSEFFNSQCQYAVAGQGLPWRGFNWQHRSNAWGTHLWVKNEEIKRQNPLHGKRLFGTLDASLSPYVFSSGLGWLYHMKAGWTDEAIYFYEPRELGWFLTNESVHPWFYSYIKESWMYYFMQEPIMGKGSWFYNIRLSDYQYLTTGF